MNKGLTVDGERDFSFHGSDAERIAGFATETGVVVTRFSLEGVNITRLASCSFVRVVDLKLIAVPDDGGEWIATARDALETNVLPSANCFAFRVANNFGRTGRI